VLGAPNGGADTQAGRTPRNLARRPGWIGSLAPAMLSLRALLSLRPGEAEGELTDVVSADQLAHDGVARWRHCPVIAGCAAAPDPPPRVLAPEPLKSGILVVPAWPGVHGGRREVAGRPQCCGRRAGAWMAADAMQLPPSRRDLRRALMRLRRHPGGRGCRSKIMPSSGSSCPPPGRPGPGDPGISSCKSPGPLTALHPPAQPRCPASRRRPRGHPHRGGLAGDRCHLPARCRVGGN
jgi:hypothetical protein